MTRNLTCILCNKPVEEQSLTFVKGDKIWTVPVLVCKDETCLVKRGGVSTEYRKEKRGKIFQAEKKEEPPPEVKPDGFSDILGKDFSDLERKGTT